MPTVFHKTDCIAPIAAMTDVRYSLRALEPSTLFEVTPTALSHIPDKLQVWIYKHALQTNDRCLRQSQVQQQDLLRKNQLLCAYMR